jgi:sulfur relay protein TusB/DsrH
MLVIVKNAPDTPDGKQGLTLARDMGADLVCLQNGVYFAQGKKLEGFGGSVYVLDEDLRLRGLSDAAIGKEIKKVDYDTLVDLMAASEKVVGMF